MDQIKAFSLSDHQELYQYHQSANHYQYYNAKVKFIQIRIFSLSAFLLFLQIFGGQGCGGGTEE